MSNNKHSNLTKITLGGGCHWCTEAIFQSLIGIEKVEQGFVASNGKYSSYSEAVIVHFNPMKIDLKTLIEIHLLTHKSTSQHSMRDKYRSAIYYFDKGQKSESESILQLLQPEYSNQIITQVLEFVSFKPSREEITDYFYKNPDKPFCENYIKPKLRVLLDKFSEVTNTERLNNTDLLPKGV